MGDIVGAFLRRVEVERATDGVPQTMVDRAETAETAPLVGQALASRNGGVD
jgi:hypothetical protein